MNRRDALGMMSLAVFADFGVLEAAQARGNQGRGRGGRGGPPPGPRPAAYPEQPTKTPASVREPFVGTYRLAMYAPHGDNPIGRIQYDRGGRMWALLHPPSRPLLPQMPTAEDYQATYRGFVAYYGTFDVDPAAGQVTHHVQAGSNPAWFGTDFVRWYRLEGNRLILSLNAEFNNPLTWERLPETAGPA